MKGNVCFDTPDYETPINCTSTRRDSCKASTRKQRRCMTEHSRNTAREITRLPELVQTRTRWKEIFSFVYRTFHGRRFRQPRKQAQGLISPKACARTRPSSFYFYLKRGRSFPFRRLLAGHEFCTASPTARTVVKRESLASEFPYC